MAGSFDPARCPVFVNTRDRVHDLRRLVEWLEQAGHERITLLDNDSTFEPLLEWFESTGHTVVRLGQNLGSRALWYAGLVPNEPFIYSDPDVIPTDDCPLDAVAHLYELIGAYSAPKAALGLYLDDVPVSLRCLEWERRLLSPWTGDSWRGEIATGVFDSLSDTTFALYRPNAPFGLRALRTGFPYSVRHQPWYPPTTQAEREERDYYMARALGGPEGSSTKDGRQC